MLYIGITSIHLCGKKDENMGNRFSIEELTCLHLLRCHYADICGKEERELRETIALHPATFAKAKMICEKEKEANIGIIPYYADDYPVSFAQIGVEAPALIHLLGNKELLYNENSIAIIGSRNTDDVRCNIAYQLARDNALKGNVIVSGLALGCDSAAHQGCIDANGKTIAVVASGLNIVHPKANEFLQQEIIDKGGLIISEQPFGVKANPVCPQPTASSFSTKSHCRSMRCEERHDEYSTFCTQVRMQDLCRSIRSIR